MNSLLQDMPPPRLSIRLGSCSEAKSINKMVAPGVSMLLNMTPCDLRGHMTRQNSTCDEITPQIMYKTSQKVHS